MDTEYVKDLLTNALFVALVGGLGTIFVSSLFGIFSNDIVNALVLFIAMLLIAGATKVEAMRIWDVALLLVAVILVGTIIVAFLPLAAPYILSFTGTNIVSMIAWSLVWIGAGVWVRAALLGG